MVDLSVGDFIRVYFTVMYLNCWLLFRKTCVCIVNIRRLIYLTRCVIVGKHLNNSDIIKNIIVDVPYSLDIYLSIYLYVRIHVTNFDWYYEQNFVNNWTETALKMNKKKFDDYTFCHYCTINISRITNKYFFYISSMRHRSPAANCLLPLRETKKPMIGHKNIFTQYPHTVFISAFS